MRHRGRENNTSNCGSSEHLSFFFSLFIYQPWDLLPSQWNALVQVLCQCINPRDRWPLPRRQQALSDLIFVSCSPNAISKLQTSKREMKINISLQCQQQRILSRVVACHMAQFSFRLLAPENGERSHLLRSSGSSPCLPAAPTQRDRCRSGAYEPTRKLSMHNPLCEKALLSAQPPSTLWQAAQWGAIVYFIVSSCPVLSSLSRTLTVGKNHTALGIREDKHYFFFNSTLLSPLPLSRESWDPGWEQPTTSVSPAPSPA